MNDTSPGMRTYPLVEPVLETIASWIRRYRYAAKTRQDFEQCGPDEVARIAHELGMEPRELADLASKGPDAAEQLGKLLRALGADLDAVKDPVAKRDLQRLCITCSHKRQCEHDLAAGTAAQNYHDYCPNAVALDELLAAAPPAGR